MRKEDFFDTLEDIEPKYIYEALSDDDSLGVAKPGKAKITPMKILAPIAACVALGIGAAVGVPKLAKLAAKLESGSESTSGVEYANNPNSTHGVYTANGTVHLNFEATGVEQAFLDECISIIASESDEIARNKTDWNVVKPSHFCPVDDDYFIQPMIDGKAIPEIGARVFHKISLWSSDVGDTYHIREHGAFGLGYDELDISKMTDDEGNVVSYYYRKDVTEDVTTESIMQVMFTGNPSEPITERAILEKRNLGSRNLYYGNWGSSIGEDEFIGTWNTYVCIPKIYTEFTNEEIEQCREALKAAHGIPKNADLFWRDAEIDLDFDGTKELLLSARNVNHHNGVYVYARTTDGIREVGSFDTEFGVCKPEQIRIRNVSAGNVFPYYFSNVRGMSRDGRINYADFTLNKILIKDGKITTEEFAVWGTRIVDEEKQITEDYFVWNGEEVGRDAFMKEWNRYETFGESHKYYKPNVTTDPNNYAWD